MKIKNLFWVLIFLTHSFILNAQDNKNYKVACIAFYNIENLFDTIDTKDVKDTEYTPVGSKKWNSEKYYNKLEKLSEVISLIGTDVTPDGPAILGVSEIENSIVLEDLVKTEKLKSHNYKIIHYDSPDKRGVDVALLYQPEYFKVTRSKSYTLKMEGDTNFFTRDQLLVSGIFDGEPMHFIVNHWPSRRGGEKKSRPKRNAAAVLCRSIVDSILQTDKNAKIIVMGDLNDDPTNPSVKEHLRTKGKVEELANDELYNPMYKLYKNGAGSLAYRDSWNMFDQIILSRAFIDENKSSYKFYKAKIFNKSFLLQKEGPYKGYPLRTHAGGVYLNGYSDHFPVYVYLVKEEE